MARKLDPLAEHERLETMRKYENSLGDVEFICGIDEAGRGPLAGPVVAGACILPRGLDIYYLNDSKKLSEKRREELYEVIKEKAIAWSVAEASVEEIDEMNILEADLLAMRRAIAGRVGIVDQTVIDEINILQATYKAMRTAINAMGLVPGMLLNDAVTIPGVDIPQLPIIHGDAKSVSIAAASILAKVTRDHIMLEYDRIYPGYGFAKHKGYGTADHISAIKTLGPCEIHRRTFIKNFI